MTMDSGCTRLMRVIGDAGTRVTDVPLGAILAACTVIEGHETERLATLGVKIEGNKDLLIMALRPDRPFGTIHISNFAPGGVIILGEHNVASASHLGLRLIQPNAIVAFPDMTTMGHAFILPNVLLRSAGQILFWGAGSSAVMAQIELEGDDQSVIVGDDVMISNGVWLRNHDMHAIFDTQSGVVTNLARGSITIEQHAWLGQEVLLLGPRKVGFGSIIAARATITTDVPPESLMVGSPARLLKSGVSWFRGTHDVEPATVSRLARLRGL